jgi:hypothetical protein
VASDDSRFKSDNSRFKIGPPSNSNWATEVETGRLLASLFIVLPVTERRNTAGSGIRFPKQSTLAAHIGQAHICAMSRIACNCGAIYEAAPKRRPRDPDPFKCLVCGKKVNAGEYRIGELRIVARPEPDRD